MVPQLRGNVVAVTGDMCLRAVRHCCVAFFAGLCVMATASAAYAREVSVQEAVAQAQHKTNGKVIAVQTLHVGKRKVYRIKVITRDGLVRVVEVAAEQ